MLTVTAGWASETTMSALNSPPLADTWSTNPSAVWIDVTSVPVSIFPPAATSWSARVEAMRLPPPGSLHELCMKELLICAKTYSGSSGVISSLNEGPQRTLLNSGSLKRESRYSEALLSKRGLTEPETNALNIPSPTPLRKATCSRNDSRSDGKNSTSRPTKRSYPVAMGKLFPSITISSAQSGSSCRQGRPVRPKYSKRV